MAVVQPATAEDLAAIITDAADHGQKLAISGGNSKTAIGAPAPAAVVVDMTAFAGVIDYDPPELVLTVGAGTPLAQIQALVASEKQMLAFDPFDHGPIYGALPGAATIGGVVAAGVSGSRCVSAGGVRDHLLGFAGVSGRGERFVAGAKVVKNVTGYDLPKLVCGSWGRLVALTEVTLKVLPCPVETVTRVYRGLSLEQGLATMIAAMRAQASVAAAAYVPPGQRSDRSMTALRLEGVGPSIRARLGVLDTLPVGDGDLPADDASDALWHDLRTLAALDHKLPLWRISLPAKGCVPVINALAGVGAHYLIDWAGGLVWLSCAGDVTLIRDAVSSVGGHAMLVRAAAPMRTAVPAFHPQPGPLAALEARVRRAFDPAGVFETGRFGDMAHAH